MNVASAHHIINRAKPFFLSKGAWAVLDQGLFAGSNFVMNVLLARWLSPDAYGIFWIAFTIFLLLATVHNGLLIEPMLVFGPGRHHKRMSRYGAAMLWGHLVVSLPIALLIAVGGAICWMIPARASIHSLGATLLVLAVVAPLILFLWLMRRACYVRTDPRRAAVAGLAYAVLMVASMFVLNQRAWLSTTTALLTIGAASLITSLWLVMREGFGSPLTVPSRMIISAGQRHWRYGRWAAATGVIGFIPGNIFLLMLPAMTGTAQSAGALRSVMNLVMPFIQANSALGTLLLPRLIGVRDDQRQTSRILRKSLVVMVGAPLAWWLVAGLFHGRLFHLVYHGGYAEYASLLWILGLWPVLTGLRDAFTPMFQIRERPNLIFFPVLAAGIFTVAGGALLMRHDGVRGAAITVVVVHALHLVMMAMAWPRVHAQAPVAVEVT